MSCRHSGDTREYCNVDLFKVIKIYFLINHLKKDYQVLFDLVGFLVIISGKLIQNIDNKDEDK